MDAQVESRAETQEPEAVSMTLNIPRALLERLERHHRRYCDATGKQVDTAEFLVAVLQDSANILDAIALEVERRSRRVVGPDEVIATPRLIGPRDIPEGGDAYVIRA